MQMKIESIITNGLGYNSKTEFIEKPFYGKFGSTIIKVGEESIKNTNGGLEAHLFEMGRLDRVIETNKKFSNKPSFVKKIGYLINSLKEVHTESKLKKKAIKEYLEENKINQLDDFDILSRKAVNTAIFYFANQ